MLVFKSTEIDGIVYSDKECKDTQGYSYKIRDFQVNKQKYVICNNLCGIEIGASNDDIWCVLTDNSSIGSCFTLEEVSDKGIRFYKINNNYDKSLLIVGDNILYILDVSTAYSMYKEGYMDIVKLSDKLEGIVKSLYSYLGSINLLVHVLEALGFDIDYGETQRHLSVSINLDYNEVSNIIDSIELSS